MTDAENNKTTYVHDGHDRLSRTQYPSATKGAGTSNSGDYEQSTYETTAGGTRTSGTVTAFRNRANETVAYTVDALGRMTAKNLPGSEPDVTYGFDLLGRMTSAAQTGNSLSFTYDALGRNLTQAGLHGTVTSTWDIAGRRTRIAHPGGFYVDQDYLVTGETWKIRENGAASGVGVLATYVYDNLGRRASLTRGDGSVLSYSYDAASRLTSLADNLVGAAYDQILGFGYTPASQIASNTRSNDAYAWTGHYNLNRGYTANGRNQYTATGSITPTYDTKGNLTSAGATTYTYTSENLLTSASGGIALAYDPAMRLYQSSGGSAGTTRFAYDGADLIAEYNGSNAILRRYVHGPGVDEPLVWYEGSGTTDRRFLHADERGSVVAVTNSSGTTLNVNGYNEYGIPSSGNVGRFQYTGQTWLPELGMYYYKARIYSPTLGRFLQTDPIGFGGGMNLYGYVGGDPVNFADPSGLTKAPPQERIVCTGTRRTNGCGGGGISSGLSGFTTAAVGGQMSTGADSLANLGVSTDGMSNGEIRALAAEFLNLGEQLAQSSLPRDAVVIWGFGSSGLTAGAIEQAGLIGDVSEILSQMAEIRAIGAQGEALARSIVVKNGYAILGEQVYVRTSAGMRIIDILAQGGLHAGLGLVGWEVKANGATRNPSQILKDRLLSTEGGEIRSRALLGGGLYRDQHVRINVGVIQVFVTRLTI